LAGADRHCVFHAMASCLPIWPHNRDALGRAFCGAFAEGRWLVLGLQRLMQRIDPAQELAGDYLAAFEVVCLRRL
jgi:hypothetical protein